MLDPGHSPHSTSRPSISSTAATRLAGAGSLSAVLATTTRRLRASMSSRSTRRARSSPPMQSSIAAPGWRISATQNARKQHRNVLDHRKQFGGGAEQCLQLSVSHSRGGSCYSHSNSHSQISHESVQKGGLLPWGSLRVWNQ